MSSIRVRLYITSTESHSCLRATTLGVSVGRHAGQWRRPEQYSVCPNAAPLVPPSVCVFAGEWFPQLVFRACDVNAALDSQTSANSNHPGGLHFLSQTTTTRCGRPQSLISRSGPGLSVRAGWISRLATVILRPVKLRPGPPTPFCAATRRLQEIAAIRRPRATSRDGAMLVR